MGLGVLNRPLFMITTVFTRRSPATCSACSPPQLYPETAMAVGQRKDRAPVLLRVAAEEAHREGVAFYHGNDKVWLADAVPARFIQRVSDEA